MLRHHFCQKEQCLGVGCVRAMVQTSAGGQSCRCATCAEQTWCYFCAASSVPQPVGATGFFRWAPRCVRGAASAAHLCWRACVQRMLLQLLLAREVF